MEKLSFIEFDGLSSIWDEDTIEEIVHLINKKHAAYLENEQFELLCGYNNEQIQVKIILKKIDNSVVYPIEIICVYDEYKHIKKHEIAQLILDYIDVYWYEYLTQERNTFVSIDWSCHECESIQFYIRGFVRNLALENQADAFLKEHGHGDYEIFSISSEI